MRWGTGERRSPLGPRLMIGMIVAAISLVSYFGSSVYNPVTGEKQHIGGITVEQEIGLGLEAAPQMAAEFGGVSSDPEKTRQVTEIGERLVTRTDAGKTGYEFEFHLLADEETINAFALPGGQVFITEGLRKRLETDGQIAGVLGHEIGHVVARHGAEHIAKAQLTQGLTGAAVLATYDPGDRSSGASQAVIMAVGQLVNLKFSREDELESDQLGVRFTAEAGYDPRGMIKVMQVLEAAAGEKGSQPEFFATHPNPENRIERINAAIAETFPNGVPEGLEE